MRISGLPLAVLFFSLFLDQVHAQGCCTVGAASLGGVESGVLSHKTLAVGLNYQHNSLTRAFQGTRSIPDPLQRTADVGLLSLTVEYGLQPKLSLLATLGYSAKSREITVVSTVGGVRFAESVEYRASGFGDMMILAKYRLIAPTLLSPYELSLGGGVNLPTGGFTEEQRGSQLAIDLQPGTGAAAIIGWAFASKSFPDMGLRVFGTFTYRYSGTNFDGYRFGDEINSAIGADYSIADHFAASFTLRSRFAQRDYANRRVLTATGGSYHDLMPAISYSDGPSHARVFVQFPLYRNVRGIQLTVTYMLGVEYKYVFDFRSLTDLIVPEL